MKIKFNTDILNYISTVFTKHKVWIKDSEFRDTYMTDDYIKLSILSHGSATEALEIIISNNGTEPNVALLKYKCGTSLLERPIYFRDLYNLVDNIIVIFLPDMLKLRYSFTSPV